MSRFNPRTLFGFALVVAMLASTYVISAGVGFATAGPRRHPPAASDGFYATIAYAVDGDTLRIRERGDLAYVRLIGIDSPESVKPGTPVECGAEAASRSMDRLAPEGARVFLQWDGERHDVYGRILAHAFVDGRQLETAQLRRGWAEVYRFDGRTFTGLAGFYAAQASARSAARGVWGRCGGDFHSAEPGTQD
jgi:micrococcal nuclease